MKTTLPSLGVFLPTMATTAGGLGDVAAAARHAEELGFESVWVVDQLVAGTGAPALIDSVVALATAAGATDRIGLGLGVLIVPLRPVVWIARQLGSLQHVAGGRLLFGAGVGGDRHALSWAAAGVPRGERGARTDAALAALPDLLAGRPTALPDVDGEPVVQLAPAVPVPPILVGGTAEAALRRTVRFADGWFAMPAPPEAAAPAVRRLAELAAEAGRAAPSVTGSALTALDVTAGAVHERLTDPDGVYGMPAAAVDSILVSDPRRLVERLAGWGELGAERVVLTLAGDDWYRQADLVAEAALAGANA